MSYSSLAFGVDVFHVIFMLFMVFGGVALIILRIWGVKVERSRFVTVYLVCWAAGVLSNLMLGACPLSVLSWYLRRLGNPAMVHGKWDDSFVVRLIERSTGYGIPGVIVTMAMWILGIAVLTVFVARRRRDASETSR